MMETYVFQSSSLTEGYPGYPERTGDSIEVLSTFVSDAEDDNGETMHRIRFSDGVETDAFTFEVIKA
jgi:hypothetical protein